MQKLTSPVRLYRSFVVVLAVLLLPSLVGALVPVDNPAEKAQPAGNFFRAPELGANPSLVRFERGDAGAATKPGMGKFFGRHSADWQLFWDQRGNRPHLIQGRGIPMVPGTEPTTLEGLENKLRGFMDEFSELFAIDQGDLVLDPSRSGQFGSEGQLWFVELQQHHDGVPVAGANVFFRINHGNLVQFGNHLIGPVRTGTKPRLSEEDALVEALAAGGFEADRLSELLNPGELMIVPLLSAGETPGHTFTGAPGQGYRHALVREVVFRLTGDAATYKALVDAHTGKVLELVDTNRYTVRGGVYPETFLDPEQTLNLPNCQETSGCTQLNGTYARIADNCGSINRCDCDDGSCDGTINLGTSSGTDCTTPGYGGYGNTHAARTTHYHVSTINRVADVHLPTNSWIDSKLTANTNIVDVCNAYWDGSTINMFRSGSGCGNTGEIAAVVLHEWGHGLDQNTGGGSDAGSGETVGDSIAMIQLRTSCVGRGFQSTPCHNCATCTGVRDPGDFSYQDGTATIAMPSTVTSNTGIDCDLWACPYYGYMGVMGYEGHCESYISSAAIWDLGVELRNAFGTEGGWDKLEELWYDSMTPSKQAYQIVSGGQCNPSATIDGCASTNYFQVFLVADDDDGNLANGTPNCERIWDAFNYHGIACGTKTSACGGGSGPTQIFDEVPVTGISGALGEQIHYYMIVPSGQTSLDFTMSGGTGDADMYVKYGSQPTLSSYDCRPYAVGNNETCHFNNPAAGTWYVMIHAYSAFSGVTLVGDYEGGSSGWTDTVDDSDSAEVYFGGPSEWWWEVWGYGINNQMHYTWNVGTPGEATNFIYWYFNVPASDTYKVEVFIPRNHATATNARYYVHDGTQWQGPFIVNQNIYYDEWVTLTSSIYLQAGQRIVYTGDYTGEPTGTTKLGVDAARMTQQ